MLSSIGSIPTLTTWKHANSTTKTGCGVTNAMHGRNIILQGVIILMAIAIKGQRTLETLTQQAAPQALI